MLDNIKWAKEEPMITGEIRYQAGRHFYLSVRDAGFIKTLLITMAAFLEVVATGKSPCWEHFKRPQDIGYWLFDNPDKWQTYDEFKSIFDSCREVIGTTPEENVILKGVPVDPFSYVNTNIEVYRYEPVGPWKSRKLIKVSNDFSETWPVNWKAV